MRKDIVKILPLGEINKLGIDIISPSFDYLKENASRVVAIIITHGHDDVMGALPYLLEAVNAPIYAPALTADLIDQMLKRHKKHNNFKINYQLNRVKRNDSIEIEGVPVEFFPVTHSIPGGVGVAISCIVVNLSLILEHQKVLDVIFKR